jgi:hypothetical protein
MHRIDSKRSVSGMFSGGDPARGIPGTVVDAPWLNAIQEELAALVEDLGGTLVKGTNDQILARLQARFAAMGTANTWTAKQSWGNLDHAHVGPETHAVIETWTGNSLAATAVTNGLCGKNICKAWGVVNLTEAGVLSILDGFNVSGVEFSGGTDLVKISLAGDMSDGNYAVSMPGVMLYQGATPYPTLPYNSTRVSGYFNVRFFYLPDGSSLNLSGIGGTFSFVVFGAQG